MEVTDLEAGGVAGKGSGPSVWHHVVGLWKACRPWVVRATLLFAFGMFCLGALIKYRAESNLLSVFLAYSPAWVMALPFLGTLFLGVAFVCWRTVLLSVAAPLVLTLWLGGYSFADAPSVSQSADDRRLVVMTYNRGQGSERVLTSCAAANNPDVAVFQDAARRLAYLSSLPQFASHTHSHQNGEFVLLSRWPLVENEVVQLAWPENASGILNVGTRSVIDWNGRPTVVYNIHLPTPRDLLYWYGQRGTFLYGVLGLVPHTPLHARHQQYLATWKARVDLVSQLMSRVRLETAPVILLGDLNLPPAGHGYQILCGVLRDAHEAAGGGFGHTFPGNMKSIARHFAPWIRIDHIFVSSRFEVLSCRVSRDGASQHLPVAASIRIP